MSEPGPQVYTGEWTWPAGAAEPERETVPLSEYEAEQADEDWWHSPAWSAHEDEIDRLQMEDQHTEALAENEAREIEAGS